MSTDFDLVLDLRLGAVFPTIGHLWTLFSQPKSRKTYEVGGEQGKVFLEMQSWARAYLEVPNFKNLFGFFVAGFNCLTSIVIMKPGWQIRTDIPMTEMQQSRVAIVGNCLLPCWWGITPGVTTWDQTHQYFKMFADEIMQGVSQPIVENNNWAKNTIYVILYYVESDSEKGWVYIDVLDEIVVGLEIGRNSTRLSFQLHQLLNEYGKPEKVLIRTFSDSPDPDFYLPFNLVMYYPEQGILAHYKLEAEKEGEYLVA